MTSILKMMVGAIAVVAFVSCKKDKEDPTISINQPADMETYSSGDELHVEVVFEDDRALKSYDIHIGNETGVYDAEFGFQFAGDISGKTYSFHEHFIVPDSIEEAYYLHFQVTDEEGKSITEKRHLHFTP